MLGRWPWEQCGYCHRTEAETELSVGMGKQLPGGPSVSQRAGPTQREAKLPEKNITSKKQHKLKGYQEKPKIFLSRRKENKVIPALYCLRNMC